MSEPYKADIHWHSFIIKINLFMYKMFNINILTLS